MILFLYPEITEQISYYAMLFLYSMLELLFFIFGLFMKMIDIQMQQFEECSKEQLIKNSCDHKRKKMFLIFSYVLIKIIDVVYVIVSKYYYLEGLLLVNVLFNAFVLNTFKVLFCYHIYRILLRIYFRLFESEEF